MIVKCLTVSYGPQFNGATFPPALPGAEPVQQTDCTASITFVYADATDLPRAEQFTLTLSGVDSPLEYFPGEFYDLALEPVAPPEEG